MPKLVVYRCDLCGQESDKAETFSKKVPPYYFLNIYVCPKCYQRMFSDQLKRFEERQKEINGDKNAK